MWPAHVWQPSRIQRSLRGAAMLWSCHATSMPISWFAHRRQPTQQRLRARALRLCECTPLRQRRVRADASPFGGHQAERRSRRRSGGPFRWLCDYCARRPKRRHRQADDELRPALAHTDHRSRGSGRAATWASRAGLAVPDAPARTVECDHPKAGARSQRPAGAPPRCRELHRREVLSSAPPESLPGHHSSQVLQFSSLGQDRRRRRCVAASPPNDVG